MERRRSLAPLVWLLVLLVFLGVLINVLIILEVPWLQVFRPPLVEIGAAVLEGSWLMGRAPEPP